MDFKQAMREARKAINEGRCADAHKVMREGGCTLHDMRTGLTKKQWEAMREWARTVQA